MLTIKKVLFIIAVIYLTLGILYRCAGLQYCMGEDEINHNDLVLESKSIRELRSIYVGQFQPLLEYALRKEIWFKILNPINDTALRIPSAFYSIIALILGFYFFCRKRKYYFSVFFLILFSQAAIEIHYAHEARHYTLVSLAGLLFTISFYNLIEHNWKCKNYSKKVLLFYLSSLLLLNSHFFSIILIMFCWFFLVLKIIKNVKIVLMYIFSFTLILILTWIINYPAIKALNLGPPGALEARFSILTLQYSLAYKKFIALITNFSQINYFEKFILPGSNIFYFVFFIILLNLVLNFSYKRFAFYFSTFISLYSLLLICSYRSNYVLAERYFMFYSPIIIILITDAILTLLFSMPIIVRKVIMLIKKFYILPYFCKTMLNVGLLLFFVYFTVRDVRNFPFKYENIQRLEDISNVNNAKSLMLNIRKENKESLILDLGSAWNMDVCRMYLKHLYQNKYYPQFPTPEKITVRCIGIDGVKTIDDLQNKEFEMVYLWDYYGNPFKDKKLYSDIFIFDDEYCLKIYRRDGKMMQYNDIIECFKIIDPAKENVQCY